jgi:hypothetical protein
VGLEERGDPLLAELTPSHQRRCHPPDRRPRHHPDNRPPDRRYHHPPTPPNDLRSRHGLTQNVFGRRRRSTSAALRHGEMRRVPRAPARALRAKRAPETKPSPLRQGAGSRRSRSVDSERPAQGPEMTKASVGLVEADARVRGVAGARIVTSRRIEGDSASQPPPDGAEDRTSAFPGGCRTNQTRCTNRTMAVLADLVRTAQVARAGPPRPKWFTPES